MGSDPRISVLIPTYRPQPDLFRQTLRSVISQTAANHTIDIEVIDDASPDKRPDGIVREIGDGRVSLFRQPHNLGLAGNWNSCIERARGEWIHILHQDDLVYEGFYDALCSGLKNADVGIAFCRHEFVDATGQVIGRSDLERESSGIVDNFLLRIASGQKIQFAAALLRRSACAESGGFDKSLSFALDWEMWARLASRYAVWFEPRVLACYRIHSNSTGFGLAKSGHAVRDHRRAVALISSYVPMDSRNEIRRLARQSAVNYLFSQATSLVEHGSVRQGLRCGCEAFLMSCNRGNLFRFLQLIHRASRRGAE
jgi:glycosyltransferase involved in cell wall biosynthesis